MTEFQESEAFARPADVFAGHSSGIADSMAALRLQVQSTLMSLCDGIDLIATALVQTTDEYAQVDMDAYARFQMLEKDTYPDGVLTR